jgi:hypothetical protein
VPPPAVGAVPPFSRRAPSLWFVQRFHVFEMPLLGYAGNLPFGVFRALLVELIPVKKPEPASLTGIKRAPPGPCSMAA